MSFTGTPMRDARVLVAAALLALHGCGDGAAPPGWQPVYNATLTWEQPDGLADHFLVKTGKLLKQTEHPSVTLALPRGVHVIEISACNEAGCSEPTVVVITGGEGGWHLSDGS
jgi:hypothetical protein